MIEFTSSFTSFPRNTLHHFVLSLIIILGEVISFLQNYFLKLCELTLAW